MTLIPGVPDSVVIAAVIGLLLAWGIAMQANKGRRR